MGYGRFLFAVNAVLCFTLAYLMWFNAPLLFGSALRHDSAGRVTGALFLAFALLSATGIFENSNTRIYIARIFAVFHGLMFLVNAYNFLTATMPFLVFAVHFVLLIAFLVMVFRGVSRFD